jgi:hypothetical protein
MSALQERIEELAEQHGSLRAAARVLQVDHAWLWRLARGQLREDQDREPSAALLRKLGLRRVVSYERTR